ncbi:Aste57867_21519 [Aphanomyces stellatus]|uniref:Aste57867_21519 protein n=1 Tax=Aphanomyces stellatus TaxID=120398 RepID=A0A485LJU1_9STRA|nr:hypothetical protein As57867_021450 [Aphanomyces stellatus]VFT98189.1 Aste57867_21519 [Aphanomyces stellatus]
MHSLMSPSTHHVGTSFRGHCLYKTGKCSNERALKTNGQPHNLCDAHRAKQNQNQRKMDSKMRHKRHYAPYDHHHRHDYDGSYDHGYYHPQSPPAASVNVHGHHDFMTPAASNDITIPTPAFLKGPEREAFRSRVLQKLLTVISEEVAPFEQYHHDQHYYHSAWAEPQQSQQFYTNSPPPRLPSLATCISRQVVSYGSP